jgi:amidase
VRRIARSQRVFTYSIENPPAARISSGERFLVETNTAFGDTPLQAGSPLVDPDPNTADPLTGPVHVEGAEVGDTLAVHIESITIVGQPAIGPLQGVSAVDWGALPVDILTVTDGRMAWSGLALELRPMVGCIAVAPKDGPIRSINVGDHGGNLDTKYICANSTVYLPVFHPGAGLVLGDCHAMQGDGEISGSPPETDAEVVLTVELIKGASISRPRVLSEDRFMMLASAGTLEEAIRLGVQDMIDALANETNLTRDQAYVFMTLKPDLEISQVVNSSVTVRVALDRTLWDELRLHRSDQPPSG